VFTGVYTFSGIIIKMPKMTKETIRKEQFCKVGGFEFKDLDDDKIIGGFIATTHLDSGFEHPELGWVCDKIDKELLGEWATELNQGIPRANKVSIHHDRKDKIVAGVAQKNTASIIELPDGEYGLYVDSLIDSTHPDYSTTDHRLGNGTLDSFSIEFCNSEFTTYSKDGFVERHLHPGTELLGYTLASRPMNEYAVRIKEVNMNQNKIGIKEENKMTEDKIKELEAKEKELTEKADALAKKEQELKEEAEKPAEEEPTEEEPKESTISKEDLALLKEIKSMKASEAKEKEMKEFVKQAKEELKESLDKVDVKSKVQVKDTEDLSVEVKEIKEYADTVIVEAKEHKDGRVTFEKEGKIISVDKMWHEAGQMADKLGLTVDGLKMDAQKCEHRKFDNFTTNGKMLETKGLGIDTNQGSINYLSAVELADVFDPVIHNALNQETVTWNVLSKEDKSMKGNNQVQFKVKTAANTTTGAYLGNAVTTGNVTRINCQTKFKKYQVGVEVDGDMIAAARGGPIGDVFSNEVRDSTIDLMADINVDLYAEVGAETAAGVIGFEYITDSAGNTTLYSYTRSSTTDSANVFLNPSSAGDTYINQASADITLSNLRAAKRQALKNGAQIGNLVYFTDHIQGDKFRGIYDAAQRNTPTSTRWGFEGRPEFDGIPIFEDKDCNDDDWFLVDLTTHKIAMWVPPTLEMLGKDSDSEKGFIKTYFATYNTFIRRMVQIYGCATT